MYKINIKELLFFWFFLVFSMLAVKDAVSQDWSPLQSNKFLQELISPWIAPPNGSSGAPRQGWLNTVDGFFTREVHLGYDWTETDGSNFQRGFARLNYPWTQRFWTGLEVPFVVSDGDNTSFGDITLTTQVMIYETRNISFNIGSGFTFPTSDDEIGGDLYVFTPQANLWTDIGAGFSFRAGFSGIFDNEDGYDAFRVNTAIGQTITSAENTPFGEFTYYLSGNLVEPDEGDTFLSLTPGVRSRLYGNLFLLLGIEIPVINRSSTFDQRLIGQFVFGF